MCQVSPLSRTPATPTHTGHTAVWGAHSRRLSARSLFCSNYFILFSLLSLAPHPAPSLSHQFQHTFSNILNIEPSNLSSLFIKGGILACIILKTHICHNTIKKKKLFKPHYVCGTIQFITVDCCLIALWVHQLHFLLLLTQTMDTGILPALMSTPKAGVNTSDASLYGPVGDLSRVYIHRWNGWCWSYLQTDSRLAPPVYMGCECPFAHILARI